MDCSPDTVLPRAYEDPALEPNPDISGVGVVFGFVTTAYIALGFLLINYLIAHEPETSPFDNGDEDYLANPVDTQFLATARRWLRITGGKPGIAAALHECVMDMCDIQLMTGFAILISGFVSLGPTPSRAPLSAYHWLIAVSLAWFSCVTHLSGLVALRTYMRDRPRQKYARVLLMFMLLIMTCVALVPTGFNNWDKSTHRVPDRGETWKGQRTAAIPQSPAACYFNTETARTLWRAACMSYLTWHTDRSHPTYECQLLSKEEVDHLSTTKDNFATRAIDTSCMQSMVVMVLLLVVSFTARCFKLFEPLSRCARVVFRPKKMTGLMCRVRRLNAAHTRMENKPSVMEQGYMGKRDVCFTGFRWIKNDARKSILYQVITIPMLSVLLTVQLMINMVTSMLTEILFIMFTLAWGTVKLVGSRSDQVINMEIGDSENQWTFGQVMAVVLTASPVVSAIVKFALDEQQSTHLPPAKLPVSTSSKAGKTARTCGDEDETVVCPAPRRAFTKMRLSSTKHSDRRRGSLPSLLNKITGKTFSRDATSTITVTSTNTFSTIMSSRSSTMPLGHDSQLPSASAVPAYRAIVTTWAFLALFALAVPMFTETNFSGSNGPGTTMMAFWLSGHCMAAYLVLAYPMAIIATMTVELRFFGRHKFWGEEENEKEVVGEVEEVEDQNEPPRQQPPPLSRSSSWTWACGRRKQGHKTTRLRQPRQKFGWIAQPLVFFALTLAIHASYFLNYVEYGPMLFLTPGSSRYVMGPSAPEGSSGDSISSSPPTARIAATFMTTAVLYGLYVAGCVVCHFRR